MKKPVICVKNLSKRYFLNHENRGAYSTIVDTLTQGSKRWIQKMLHPFKSNADERNAPEEFWALNDISFEINEGDRVGILGKNGAGKSTLLKILSRIVEPTHGRVTIQGRIASLLEVGTGFHPELTGRENVYLNGAILGMGKKEISKKFDEIVAFSEVERFLDTPVKYYSSGMYARLGFAIAAHLDPDILIIDEVLAVGDAQFQEKCLKKLDHASQCGRTILFVSHQTPAILQLCNKAILLEQGRLKIMGPAEVCVNEYVKAYRPQNMIWNGEVGNNQVKIHKAHLVPPAHDRNFFYNNETATIQIEGIILSELMSGYLGFEIKDKRDQLVAHSYINQEHDQKLLFKKLGPFSITFQLSLKYFWEGDYILSLSCGEYNKVAITQGSVQLKLTNFCPPNKDFFEDQSMQHGVFIAPQITVLS